MGYAEWIRRHRRNLGIPFVGVALLLARFDDRYLWLSLFAVGFGEMLRVWSAGHLQKEKILTTGGPYRFIRNPLYLGSFFIAIGFSLIAGSIWIWVLVFAYFALCYIPVVRYEEKFLAQKFPEEYPKYATRVPAFYPTLRIFPHGTTQFSWRQAIANKEYNAVLGILAGYGYLIFLRS